MIIWLNIQSTTEINSLKERREQTKSQKYFENLPIRAKAVYIYDVSENKQIYALNAHLALPLASITKVMTALCALDNLNHNALIMIPPSILGINGDASLQSGSFWKVSDLVSYTLVKSSNDGAVALGKALGGRREVVRCMNKQAEDLGLLDTRFINEIGLDEAGGAGAYGSAEDVAELLSIATKKYNEIFESTKYESYDIRGQNGTLEATNTNKVQGQIVGMKSSKTGLTDLAGGNLVFEMDAGLNHIITIAILGSTEEGRFKDAIILSNAVINFLGKTK